MPRSSSNALFFNVSLPIVTVAVALSSSHAPRGSFDIKGSLAGLGDGDSVKLLVLENDAAGNRAPVARQATVVKNGFFHFRGETKEVSSAYIQLPGKKGRGNLSFYLEPGSIEMKGNADSLDDVQVTGSYNNDLQTRFRLQEAALYARIRQLYADTSMDRKLAEKEVSAIRSRIDENRKKVIRQYPSAMISGTYLYVMQDHVQLDTLKALFAQLSQPVRDTWFGRSVAAKIPARERTRIGNTAPAFSIVTTTGRNLDLQSFKGKYLLLDFWASWCVPCRAENPHLKKAYEKFGNKGFEIVSITLDDSRAKWEEALVKDGLPWIHADEVKGFVHPVARLYDVQPIPDNFLISPEGKILARRLRGEELNTLLEKYIQ